MDTQQENKNSNKKALPFLEALKKGYSIANELERAKGRFTEKTYQQRYRWAKTGAVIASCILPVISIGSGLFALSNAIEGLIPWPLVSFPLAFILLSFWEAGKSKVIDTTSELLYIKRNAGFSLLPLCFVFAIASGFASITGAEEAHEKFNKEATRVKVFYTLQLDSVRTHYDSLIESEKSSLATYMNSVSYKGKVNIHNPATKATQEASQKKLSLLLSDKREAEKEVKAEKEKAIAVATVLFDKHKKTILSIIIIVELLILVANWYRVHYDHCISKEGDLIAEVIKNENLLIRRPDLQNVLWSALNHATINASYQANQGGTPNTIGFQLGGGAPINTAINSPINSQKQQDEAIGLLRKYPQVVQVLKAGGTLAEGQQAGGVSRSTVQNVRRALKLVQSYGIAI